MLNRWVSRGLLRDCEIFGNLRIALVSSSTRYLVTTPLLLILATCAGLTIFKMGIKCKVKYLWPSHWLWREWLPASLIVISNDTLLCDKGAQFWKFLPFPPIKIMWPFLLIFLLNLCAGAATGRGARGNYIFITSLATVQTVETLCTADIVNTLDTLDTVCFDCR